MLVAEVLFTVVCAAVMGIITVVLFQGAFDSVQRRIYNNQKKWDDERK